MWLDGVFRSIQATGCESRMPIDRHASMKSTCDPLRVPRKQIRTFVVCVCGGWMDHIAHRGMCGEHAMCYRRLLPLLCCCCDRCRPLLRPLLLLGPAVDAVDADDADAIAAVLLVAEAVAMAAVVIGLRSRCSTVVVFDRTASVGFSLGCLRNRCSRLLQLSDNNWVTLVVDERAYRYVGRRTVAVVVGAAAAAATSGAAMDASTRRATPPAAAAVDVDDDEYAMRTKPIQRTNVDRASTTTTSRRA